MPLPNGRSVMKDLHFALASNNLTKGWAPQHAMSLYHSFEDTVVPEVNRESAKNSYSDWVIRLHAGGTVQYDHVGTGRQFFLGTAEFDAIRALAKAPIHQTTSDVDAIEDDIPYGDKEHDD